jgi:predicted cupin superfamily sugar epimerase
LSDEAAALIARLGLRPHPEGGHFAETYRHLPAQGGRGVTDAAEIWAYHAGAPLALTLSADGLHIAPHRLGPAISTGERPQVVVPAGCWQTARSVGDWTLVSCVVAPAFEYGSFEMAPPGWQPG